jgi:hypothetical protein
VRGRGAAPVRRLNSADRLLFPGLSAPFIESGVPPWGVQTYETTDATADSQIVALRASSANVLFTAAIPKFAAQAIRKVYDLGWRPTYFLASVANSVGAVMRPAGPDKGVGIISAAYVIRSEEHDRNGARLPQDS